MSDDDIIERGGTQEDIDAYAHDVGGACGAAYGGSCDYCGKVTPREQDKELQKAVWASLASQMTHAINCTDSEHTKQNSCVDFTEKNFDQLMQLITADRKRVALEARLNEVQNAYEYWINGRKFISSYFRERIALLTSTKEEL